MAEFGEKLKSARTKKGITQQTLADQLFVTRQAVSRWEGGSRYPDLMTAKKISNILDTSLDELLSGDDLAQYPQKNSILESPVSKGLQTVLISVVLMCYLIICVWCFDDLITIPEGINGVQVISLVTPFLFTCVLLYATVMSIQGKWNPQIAATISVTYFGVHAISCIMSAFPLPFSHGSIILLLKAFAYILVLIFFGSYFQKGTPNPLKLYIISALCAASRMYVLIEILTIASNHSQFDYVYATRTVQTLAEILFLGMLCYMVYFLNAKRKRAAL